MADNKYEDMIREEWEKANANKLFPNIMLLGETGCGKSSLINCVFGKKDLAPVNDVSRGTEGFERYEGKKHGMGVNLIDSRGYELGDERDFDRFMNDIDQEIKNCQKADPFQKIHIIWYCISVQGSKVQPYDLQTLNRLLDEPELKNRVCVVLTKCDQDDEDGSDAKAIKEVLKKEVSGNLRTFEVSTNPDLRLELDDLIEWSADQLDDKDMREAFIASQKINLSKKRDEAGKKIAFFSAAAAAIGATPIPMSQAALLTPLQVTMSTIIIKSYGLDSLVHIGGEVIGGILISNLGKTLAGELMKLLPGIGSTAGGVINATVASAITAALGCAISQICYMSCEKILKGENELDVLESAFTLESIKSVMKNFDHPDNKKNNEYFSNNTVSEHEVKAYKDSYLSANSKS